MESRERLTAVVRRTILAPQTGSPWGQEEERMPSQPKSKQTTGLKGAKKRLDNVPLDGATRPLLQSLLWRVDRLERQVRTLSELVRDHAEDADRLVRIVSEDHEVLRRELVQEHRELLRLRKRARQRSSKLGLAR